MRPDVTIHWMQETHPCAKVNNTGLVPLHLNVNVFGGIKLFPGSATFLEANSKYGDFWYSIGARRTYRENMMAGPVKGSYLTVPSVALWVRIDNFSILQKLQFFNPIATRCSKRGNSFLVMCIMLIRSV